MENQNQNQGTGINFNPTINSKSNDKPAEIIKLNLNKDELKVEAKPETKTAKAPTPIVAAPSTAWNKTPATDVTPQKPIDLKAADSKVTDVKIVDTKAATSKPAESKPLDLKAAPAGAEVKKDAQFFMKETAKKDDKTTQILENISTQKAKTEEQKLENILGKGANTLLQKSLEEEKMDRLKHKLRSRKIAAMVVALIVLVFNGYFYYQIKPSLKIAGITLFNFENNTLSSAIQTNTNLLAVQTNINKYRYLTGQIFLNQLGFDLTRFLDGAASLNNETSSRSLIQDELDLLAEKMPTTLENAKNYLEKPLTTDMVPIPQEDGTDVAQLEETTFQTELRKALAAEKASLAEAAKASGETEITARELNSLENTIQMVGNASLMNSLQALSPETITNQLANLINLEEAAQALAFKNQAQTLLSATKNQLAIVSGLKNSRINWTTVIDKLELITQKVNSEHNSGSAANKSSIQINSLDLSNQTKKISFNGINVTASGTNREVITFLIEALEASPDFKNIQNRTFPLSKSQDADGSSEYTMNFRIEMELETGEFSNKNAPLVSVNN